MGFPVATFLQSFALVVLALSWFQNSLLFNLLVYALFLQLFLFLFSGAHDCLPAGARMISIIGAYCFAIGFSSISNSLSQDNLGLRLGLISILYIGSSVHCATF